MYAYNWKATLSDHDDRLFILWFDAMQYGAKVIPIECLQADPQECASIDDTRRLIWQERIYGRHDVMHHHGLLYVRANPSDAFAKKKYGLCTTKMAAEPRKVKQVFLCMQWRPDVPQFVYHII